MKHSIAGRLLEVAKNGDYSDRLKAVRQLARIDHLKGKFYFTFTTCMGHSNQTFIHRLGLSAFSANV